MATSQNDIMIRNLQVDGSKGDAAVTADCHNLRIQGCTNVKLIDIRVKDAIHHNITTNTCVNLVADRIHSTGGGNPSKIANADGTGIILGPDGINLKLTNSTFYDSSYHGVQVYNRCRGVFINNCHITNTGQRTDTGNGLQIHPGNQDVHISNCYVSPNPILGTASASGIRFETVTGEQINGVCIENCTVENCAFAGIRIDGGSDVTIRGCNIRNNGTLATSGNDYGIRVNDGTGGTVSKHVIIIGNNIYDNQVSPTQARPIGLVGAGTDKVNIIGNNMYGHQASNQIFLDPTFVGSYYLSGNFEG
jgi:parallel beta-helix repeat protein